MPNIATSVRITGDATAVLTSLSAKLGKSKAQVIEAALKEMEERVFWSEVRDAFARTAGDLDEVARQRAEIELWERVSEHDFADEEW